jgi:hypothetical protein
VSSNISRYVALLTPLFAVAAGYVATQAARLPGAPALDSTQLTVLFSGGAAAAVTMAYKWLGGRAAWERAQLEREPVDWEGAEEPPPETGQRVFFSSSLPWPEPVAGDVEQLRSQLALPDIERTAAQALAALAATREMIEDVHRRLDRMEEKPENRRVDHHPV